MSIELRIQALILASQSKILFKHELYAKHRMHLPSPHNYPKWAETRENLHNHRVNVIRPQSRIIHVARAFLKGMPYYKVEGNHAGQTMNPKMVRKIAAAVITFSPLRFQGMPKMHIEDLVDMWAEKHYPHLNTLIPAKGGHGVSFGLGEAVFTSQKGFRDYLFDHGATQIEDDQTALVPKKGQVLNLSTFASPNQDSRLGAAEDLIRWLQGFAGAESLVVIQYPKLMKDNSGFDDRRVYYYQCVLGRISIEAV